MLITKEEVEHIENIACNQSNSLWFKFRQGRITAPIFKARVLHFLSNFFSPNDSPSKTEKCFLFYLKSSFRSRDIQIFKIFPLPFHTFQIQKNKWKCNNL